VGIDVLPLPPADAGLYPAPAANNGFALKAKPKGVGTGKHGPKKRVRLDALEKLGCVKQYYDILENNPHIAALATKTERANAAGVIMRLPGYHLQEAIPNYFIGSNLLNWLKPENVAKYELACQENPDSLGANGKHKGGRGNTLAGQGKKWLGRPNGAIFEDQEARVHAKFIKSRRTHRRRVGSRRIKNWMREEMRSDTAEGGPLHGNEVAECFAQTSKLNGWFRGYKKRHGLVFRKKTNSKTYSIMSLLPDLLRFTLSLMNLRAANPLPEPSMHGVYDDSNTFSGDQVPAAFVEGSHRGTLEQEGVERVEIAQIGSGLEKRQITLQVHFVALSRGATRPTDTEGSRTHTARNRADEDVRV
jgi:hypothetical protein